MEKVVRKKTGKFVPGALTSSRRKNQSLTRTRHKNEKKETGKDKE